MSVESPQLRSQLTTVVNIKQLDKINDNLIKLAQELCISESVAEITVP